MGLFSAISSACSAVGNAISDTFSTVSSACSSVIDAVATHAPAIRKTLVVLSVAIPHPYIKIAIPIIDVALSIVGLLKTDESTVEIGERVLQAKEANISPSDFSSYDEYMEEIRNFELDPAKHSSFNEGEKIAAGMSVQAWGLEQKFGEHSSDLLAMILKDAPAIGKGEGYFTEIRVDAILQSIGDVSEVVGYFRNTLDPDTRSEVEAKLVNIEKSINPDLPIEDIYAKLDKQTQG